MIRNIIQNSRMCVQNYYHIRTPRLVAQGDKNEIQDDTNGSFISFCDVYYYAGTTIRGFFNPPKRA